LFMFVSRRSKNFRMVFRPRFSVPIFHSGYSAVHLFCRLAIVYILFTTQFYGFSAISYNGTGHNPTTDAPQMGRLFLWMTWCEKRYTLACHLTMDVPWHST
jgi:hypothetical protein